MPRKTKIIFISVFVFVGAMLLGIYFYNQSKNSDPNGGDTSLYQKFNPFGTSNKVPNNGGDNTSENPDLNNGNTNQTKTSRLHKLTDFAVAGATFLEDTRALPVKEKTIESTPETTPTVKTKVVAKPVVKQEPTTELVPSVRYVERATGHIYQMYLDTKISGKISNSTVPSVYETLFNNKANSIIYRYASPEDNNTITSFIATLGGKSNFLNDNILEVALSPTKDKFFSLIKNTNGVIGTIKSFEETKTNQVFNSVFTEWAPQWVTGTSIYMTTKPSYLVDGSVFNLSTTNGTLNKIFGGVKGLTTLANNDGENILYSASTDTGPRLNLFNIKNHTSIDLDKYGLPEKCIWSGDNINVYCAIPSTVTGYQYPDYWYQGLISFDDFFVKINTETKSVSTLSNSIEEGTAVDATKLFLSKNEDKLFFINKKDYTLWQLDL
jgi:hypothetical protein